MSQWATYYIEDLKDGLDVTFRPRGDSMSPLIRSGDLVTVEPVRPDDIRKGDIVLCSVGRSHFLHLVKAIRGGQFMIGNNKGRINGWTTKVWGKVTLIEA
tara:strand:- start:208 stop:507 length:300 start_codon:yes stop_codon:yes gene_type:complete